MKSILKSFAFVVFILSIVACATKAATSVASLETAPTKEFAIANFSEDQLNQGKTLFENNCAQCHKLFDPESRDAEKWNNVLKRMIPKTDLAYEEGRLVQGYLVANSK